MLLRSSIAVGYMLDTHPENGDLFSVMICGGPAGINAIPGLNSNSDSHKHHHDHHSHDTTDKSHDHEASHNHATASCSFLSASSLSLITDISFINTNGVFLSDEIVTYVNHLKHRLSNNTRLARAPPSLT